MLFNSIDFFVFFAVVATQYFKPPWLIRWSIALVGVVTPVAMGGATPDRIAASVFSAGAIGLVTYLRHRGSLGLARKVLLFLASMLFYSAWRWPFTSLLLFNTVLNYKCALGISRATTEARRRLFLIISLIGNLGVLCFFKYANFLLLNLEELLGITGLTVDIGPFDIILPLGISFYTFQTMSYSIDVYRGHVGARSSILDVGLFVSFFPQLVAGPIVRASNLLPQLDEEKQWDANRAKSGLLFMLWGLIKKLLIADALAPIVNQAYANPDMYSGYALLIATYCFAFQIYCDFSGYSDVAIGAARVLGFDIPMNFRRPYFATSITTFWRRWHISLSSWLRDYLYIPLGGSRCGRPRITFNLMATMVLGGLWHGASWNFVIWGTIHGVVLVTYRVWGWLRGREKVTDESRPIPWLILATINFHVVCLAWVFFRAETFGKAINVIARVFENAQGLRVPTLFPLVLIPSLLAIEAIQARISITDTLLRFPRLSRIALYLGIGLMVALVTSSKPVDFIYFVF